MSNNVKQCRKTNGKQVFFDQDRPLILDKKWLMQDNRAGQSILWMDDWERTDCGVADKTRILKCYSSCLKVTLERLTAGGPKFEALVKDCSDDMIFDSPDLPKEINFRNYNGDEKFVNNRSNFRITYEFSTKGVVNRTQVMVPLPKSPV
uniref:Uncharacterized protein n=1 Tax=Caenorhabditis japonica TaxID=281687 RepID=A0A8R1DY05_CAEJA